MFAVSKVSTSGRVTFASRSDDGVVDQRLGVGEIEFDTPFAVPGRTAGALVADGARRHLTIDVTARGSIFDVAADVDGRLFRGMGITDPEDAEAVLVSWWTGDIRPAGIVKYTITETGKDGVMNATYTSVMSEVTGHHHPLPGQATGDTTGGFPGGYTIVYQAADDSSFGPFDWSIAEHGDLCSLSWAINGAVVIRGFGFVDPEYPDSLIVNYWGARE